MPGRWSSLLVIGLLAACEQYDDHADELVPAIACDAAAPGGVDPSAGVSFDPAEILCIGVTMAAAEFEDLRWQSKFGPGSEIDILGDVLSHLIVDCSSPFPNEYISYEADVEIGGAVTSRVGIRKKGFLGSVIGTGLAKPSLKIKTDKFVDDQTIAGTERITLNNGSQDNSRMSTCLSYAVFHAAGYPAPRCNLANVVVNDKAMGTYTHVEAVKRRFLLDHFGDDSGSLYEGTVADFTDQHIDGFGPGHLARFEAKTDASDHTGAPLIGLTRALDVSDGELLDSLEPVLNLDRFFTFWAVERLIDHQDGYTSNRNNFFVYFDPTDGNRAVLIPWGPDHSFTDEVLLDGFQTDFVRGEIARRLSRISEARARLDAELRRVLDEVWDEASVLASIDRFAAQVRSAEDGGDDYDEELARLRDWVQNRRGEVVRRLDAGLPVGKTSGTACPDPEFVHGILDGLQRAGLAQ